MERGHSISQQTLKRARLSISGQSSSYIPLQFILPNSNVVKRLFSKAGYTLGDCLKAILPENFESQLFLHLNGDLRDFSELTTLSIKNSSEEKQNGKLVRE